MSSLPEFTAEEVARHNREGDAWVILDGHVYDISVFARLHPGGKQVILQWAGKDASEEYPVFHSRDVLKKYGPRLLKGKVAGWEETRPVHLSSQGMGDNIPFGDPLWYQRLHSPYYTESHRRFRARIRQFVETQILPDMQEWLHADRPPADLLLKLGSEGYLAMMVGLPWPEQYVSAEVNAKKPENYDHHHLIILYDEISRIGWSSAIAALTNGPSIALGGVLKFGSEELKQRVAPDVLAGRKIAALAISEPQAGSDVAGLVTRAEKTADGRHYVLNGTKKWITNGTYADTFLLAAKTGEGRGNLSFFVVERKHGLETRKVDIRGASVSGTAFITLEDVKIPAENLVGEEGNGFKLIMSNFNYERFYVTACVTRLARLCLEESVRYAARRKAFGKPLDSKQDVRLRVAKMAMDISTLQVFLDYVAYQMNVIPHQMQGVLLGDIVCGLKARGSQVFQTCAEHSTFIFGGNSLYTKGPGDRISHLWETVKGYHIPAGSVPVMEDYLGRTIFKLARRYAKL